MGNGTSTLTPAQASELTRLLKVEYEFCVKKKLSNAEISAQMSKYYEEAYSTVTTIIAEPIVTSNVKKLNRGVSKDMFGTKNTGKKFERRKSFDEKTSAEKSTRRPRETVVKKQGSLDVMVNSQSATALPDTPTGSNVDSWDSVSAQPSCIICGMVFPSIQKLNTHTKYSEVHQINLKKLSNPEPQPVEVPKPTGPKAQEEVSSRCKLLYSGSKLFWRTQDTYDIHIYLHNNTDCIELIPFEGKRNAEYDRLYFSESKLVKCIGEENIHEKVSEKKKEAASQKFVRSLPPDSVLFEEEKRLAISTYLLSRIKVADEKKDLKLPGKGLDFTPDVAADSPLLDKVPDDVTPVFVPRRRHSTEAEIESKLKDISNLQEDIRQLSKRAEHIMNLFAKGVESLKSGLVTKSNYNDMRLPKKRWLMAIKRVIRINAVAANTINLRKRFGDKYLVDSKAMKN